MFYCDDLDDLLITSWWCIVAAITTLWNWSLVLYGTSRHPYRPTTTTTTTTTTTPKPAATRRQSTTYRSQQRQRNTHYRPGAGRKQHVNYGHKTQSYPHKVINVAPCKRPSPSTLPPPVRVVDKSVSGKTAVLVVVSLVPMFLFSF